jgi:hypothetical protein
MPSILRGPPKDKSKVYNYFQYKSASIREIRGQEKAY